MRRKTQLGARGAKPVFDKMPPTRFSSCRYVARERMERPDLLPVACVSFAFEVFPTVSDGDRTAAIFRDCFFSSCNFQRSVNF